MPGPDPIDANSNGTSDIGRILSWRRYEDRHRDDERRKQLKREARKRWTPEKRDARAAAREERRIQLQAEAATDRAVYEVGQHIRHAWYVLHVRYRCLADIGAQLTGQKPCTHCGESGRFRWSEGVDVPVCQACASTTVCSCHEFGPALSESL